MGQEVGCKGKNRNLSLSLSLLSSICSLYLLTFSLRVYVSMCLNLSLRLSLYVSFLSLRLSLSTMVRTLWSISTASPPTLPAWPPPTAPCPRAAGAPNTAPVCRVFTGV